MDKIRKKPIVLFILALVTLYVIIYVFPKVTGVFVSSYTLEYGELKICDETTGFFVRNEKVYEATSGGKINNYFKEGDLLKKGTTVLEINGSSDGEVDSDYKNILSGLGDEIISDGSYTTQYSGIISYYADGYESSLTPDNMKKKNLDFYKKLTNDSVISLKRSSTAKGEPLFKLVDRTQWYLVCFIDKAHKENYKVGKEIKLEFEDTSIYGNVYSCDVSDGKIEVIIETNNFYDKYMKNRCDQVTLTTATEKGLLLDNSSIGEKDGQKGVYVKNTKGKYNFVPVQVILAGEKQSIVEKNYFYDDKGKQITTVRTYDEIKKNAK